MRPMRHGYTNRTIGDGTVVEKTYAGPDAASRLRRERTLLARLQGRLPVPPVRGATAATLTLDRMPGVPGQDLLTAGRHVEVLASCGDLLRRIHQTTPDVLAADAGMPGEEPAADVGRIGDLPAVDAGSPSEDSAADMRRPGKVLVHGDFGPNNVLLDHGTFEVTAVVDWEFAHLGDPVEDLAWCEWIVRMHHPECRGALGHFFRAYGGHVPPWPVRRAAMLARCAELRRFCDRWDPKGPGVRQWRERTTATAAWEE